MVHIIKNNEVLHLGYNNVINKENLYDLSKGYYLSKNDPLFWRKLLSRRPENEEALYHVGLELEIDAKYHLGKYYATKLEKHLIVYRKIIKQALDMIKRSFNRGYVPARHDVVRMEHEIKINEQTISMAPISKNAVFSDKEVIVIGIFVVAIILGIVLATFFVAYKGSNTFTTNYLTNQYAYMLPYEVIDIKPTSIPSGVVYQPEIIEVKGRISKELLINELIGKLKLEYEREPKTAKQVLAMDENNEEIGMALWAGGNATIQVYVYPLDSLAFINEKERQLWESTTVIRSAIYQFVLKNGYYPTDLMALHQPFPNNYLTELPREPYMLKNNVTTALTGDGGWLFSQGGIPPNSDLISAIKGVVKPNILYHKDIPFSPMVISINKDNHNLEVLSGDQIIRTYSIALGKDNTTPEEELFITKKVMNPDKIIPELDNVYGTRAMELSNISYAIHGTNTPASIGKDVSQGCIRLNNADMEDLYAITPLNTPVIISRSLAAVNNFVNPDTPYKDRLYNQSNNLNEEDNSKMYYWNN